MAEQPAVALPGAAAEPVGNAAEPTVVVEDAAGGCSEMTCPFGLAHVDSPKGDLDMSASSLTGPLTTVLKGSQVYPYGTTEQFPNMVDSSGSRGFSVQDPHRVDRGGQVFRSRR